MSGIADPSIYPESATRNELTAACSERLTPYEIQHLAATVETDGYETVDGTLDPCRYKRQQNEDFQRWITVIHSQR